MLLSKWWCIFEALSCRFACIAVLRAMSRALWTLGKQYAQTSKAMPTGFSPSYATPIDLGDAWKGQANFFGRRFCFSRISRVLSLSSCPSSEYGQTKPRLFLVFMYHCESGKVGSTISYKSAFESHGYHTRNLITLLHWIE